MPSCKLEVILSRSPVDVFRIDEPIVVGRHDASQSDPPPVAINRNSRGNRLVVAEAHETSVSRNWLKIVPVSESEFEVSNLHQGFRVKIVNEQSIAPGVTRRFDRQIYIDLGAGICVLVVPESPHPADRDDDIRSLGLAVPTPGSTEGYEKSRAIGQFSATEGNEINKMLRLALRAIQEAVGSDAFFQASAEAATHMVGLDGTSVLIRRESPELLQAVMAERDPSAVPVHFSSNPNWVCVASHGVSGHVGNVSDNLLQQAYRSQETVIYRPPRSEAGIRPNVDAGDAPSLVGVECAVASPILDKDRKVIGVLYGDRRDDAFHPHRDINDTEATLFEILASSIASGIMRRMHEERQTRFSGFFAPAVVRRLSQEPKFMDGRDAEVTVLFCDIRGFSSITEKLSPTETISWINDVMSELSQCVIDRDGVLVDYVGDELLAMWGAPDDQADHALKAISSARAMLDSIDGLRKRWSGRLSQPFGAGIGINTGVARVGNVGSRQKFKYGPLGNPVNVGSRLQTATKHIGIHCCASESTVMAAGVADECRRIAQLSVVGIEEPMSVYEVVASPDESFLKLRAMYERALEDFENGRFQDTIGKLGEVLSQHRTDQPALDLMNRAGMEIARPSQPFTPVWKLLAK